MTDVAAPNKPKQKSQLSPAVARSLREGTLWVLGARLAPGTVAGGFVLIAIAVTELAISSLADAADVERHHTIFFALFDMMVLAVVCLAATLFENSSAPIRRCVEGLPELLTFSRSGTNGRGPSTTTFGPVTVIHRCIRGRAQTAPCQSP